MKKQILTLSAVVVLIAAGCNSGSDKKDPASGDTTNVNTSTPVPARQPFTKEVTYDKYKFTVTTQGEGDQHHFRLIPSGLTEANDTLQGDVAGSVKDVIIDDIDGDNFPEIGVIDVSEPNSQARIHVFSTFGGKSFGMVNLPELAPDDKALAGYKGYDEYAFVENTMVRRFPIYDGENKTSKMRQLQYKLKPGEAMKQLKLDKTIEF